MDGGSWGKTETELVVTCFVCVDNLTAGYSLNQPSCCHRLIINFSIPFCSVILFQSHLILILFSRAPR